MGLCTLTLLCTVTFAVASHFSSDSSPPRGVRTLLLLDSSNHTAHSLFIAALERERGLQLTIASTASPPALHSFGVPHFDTVMVLAPAHFGRSKTVNAGTLTQFFDDGGNLFVAGASGVNDAVRTLARNFGVEYDAAGSRVIDHFSNRVIVGSSSDSEPAVTAHSRVATSAFARLPRVVGGAAAYSSAAAPVVYDGIGMSAARDNILVVRALTGSATAYSADPTQPIVDYPESAGDDTLLVAAIQARNNARAVFTGSLWMCSDEAYGAAIQSPNEGDNTPSGNAAFCASIAAWVAQRSGVLRARDVRHSHSGDGRPAESMGSRRGRRGEDATRVLPPSAHNEPEVAR